MTINDFCAQWRIRHLITQKSIAEVAGLHKNSVSEFERGKGCSGRIISAYIVCGMEITQPTVIEVSKINR